MTTMTKSDRTAAIATILKETFAPRFELLTQQLTAAVEKNLNEQHPKFVQMCADPEMRKYLHCYTAGSVYFNNPDYYSRYYMEPHYTEVAEQQLSTIPKRDQDGGSIINVKVTYSTQSGVGYIFEVPAFESVHAALWDDLLRAASKLRETFYAYKSREAFAKDFPKLAAYLPAKVVVRTSTAVRLNPVDVMKDLASLGIPPETEEILCA